jgi:hypothetical protein
MCGKNRPRARQRDGSRPSRVRHSPARHRSDLISLDARPTRDADRADLIHRLRSNDAALFAETTCAK